MVGPSKSGHGCKRAGARFRSLPARLTPFAAHPPLSLLKLALLGFLTLGLCHAACAALQFDVFLGYDLVVPEATWFPVVCEIKNDGPSFNGVIELAGAGFNQGQSQRAEVELPTGTLKRLTIPVFSTTRGFNTTWDVRLLDSRGKVRAEQTGLRANKSISPRAPLIGALARSPSGAPVIRPILPQSSELQPTTARLQPAIFPDNALVLEGLRALYLNSERAADLRDAQVRALFAWLNAGGHLIVAIEQINDVTASPWLKSLLPCEVKDIQRVQRHPEIQGWLSSANWTTNLPINPQESRARYSQFPRGGPQRRGGLPPRPSEQSSSSDSTQTGTNPDSPFSNLPTDFSFEEAEMQVAVGSVRDGRALVAAGDVPLIVTAPRGQGQVTVLLFSPEREPARSWKNLPTFWARLAQVPGDWYVSSDFNQAASRSSDGIFGAMIDTRQVHKLPIEWLLLLLVVYLVVIGPLDQYWLKRIGRPMLTWITFPCYVVLFSLVIYFIGYKLRAGESEWNELHLVDVLLNGERAELRGRTYASVYSPSNQRYPLAGPQKLATFRGEFVGSWDGGQSSERLTVSQNGDSFKAEIFVPVWTSQLFVSDWWQSASVPLSVSLQPKADGWQVSVLNHTDQKLSNLLIVIEDRIFSLGDVPPGETKNTAITKGQGTLLREYVGRYGQAFQEAAVARQRAFGASGSGHIGDLPHSTVAASFLSQMSRQDNYMFNYVAPPGLDLSSALEHGNAVLFAWAGDFSPVKQMHQFSPRRTHRDTLWRLAVPLP